MKLMMDPELSSHITNIAKCDSSITEFKKPRLRLERKPKILPEDEYVAEMAKIIQRDFFPDLEKLKAQNDYLDALENKDFAKMEIIRRKYSGKSSIRSNPDTTPKTFETPSEINTQLYNVSSSNFSTPLPNQTESENNKQVLCKQHSLDVFVQNYTSEDNQSFQEIINAGAKKNKEKFAMLYNEEKVSSEKLMKSLTLPSLAQLHCKSCAPAELVTWKYANKNSIMYIPDGVQLSKEECINMSNRQETIHHSATRLNENPFVELNNNKCSTKQTTPQVTTQENFLNYSKQLEIGGFSLVKTPSPKPGEVISPLMTWGEIEGTPFRLDGLDTPLHSNVGPGFKINDTPHRESIAMSLTDKIGEKMRAQKQKAKAEARKNLSSPFIHTNIDRLASMSPAARRLATTKFGIRSPKITTPCPLRSLKCSKSNGATHITNPTKNVSPVAVVNLTKIPESAYMNNEEKTITDNLLKIPTKRLRASDFF